MSFDSQRSNRASEQVLAVFKMHRGPGGAWLPEAARLEIV